jgi:hypothetical protein
MAQITGRRRPAVFMVNDPRGDEYRAVTVVPYDALNNGAMVTADIPLSLTQRIDSTNPLVTYIGYAAPELANPADPSWLIRRITDDGAGNVIVEHAVVPAVPAVLAAPATGPVLAGAPFPPGGPPSVVTPRGGTELVTLNQPATPAKPARYATAEHIWNDRALLTYA